MACEPSSSPTEHCGCHARRVPRGLALPLVLTVSVVLFMLGVAVSALSMGSARLVANAEDTARSRQAAAAGLAEARRQLSDATYATYASATGFRWFHRKPTVSTGAPVADPTPPSIEERSVPGTGAFYTVTSTAQPDGSWIVLSEGYLKSGTKRYCSVSSKARMGRNGSPFRYPVQASGGVIMNNGTRVDTVDGGVAIRTDATKASTVQLSNVTVSGEIMVGASANPGTVILGATGQAAGVFAYPMPAALPPGVADPRTSPRARNVTVSVTTEVVTSPGTEPTTTTTTTTSIDMAELMRLLLESETAQ